MHDTLPSGGGTARADLWSHRGRARLVLAGLTLTALVLHLWASGRIGGPTVVFDETGYLGNARWLARSGAGWEMPTAPRYAVGYPLVLAPVTRLFSTPHSQWRAILAVNSVLLAAVVPLAYLVARRVLGATRGPALAAALAGAVVPATVAASVSAIAENLVLPLVPATVLALHRALRPGPWAGRVLFGPGVALLYATHARFSVVVAVAGALLLAAAWRRVVPVVVAAANGALMVVGCGGAWALTQALDDARWDHVERPEGGLTELAELVTTLDGWGELAWTAVGQGWYLAVGSLGLSVVGLVAVGRRVADRQVPPDGPGGRDRVASRWALGFLLVAAAGVFATSVAFFAQNQFRADHLVYGRHNDSFTPMWVAAAVIALHRLPRPAAARTLAVAAGTTAVLAAVLGLVRDAGAYGGQYSAFAIPAVIRFVGDDPSGTFWRASLAAAAGLALAAAIVLLARRPLLVAPLVAVWFAWAGLGTVEVTDSLEETVYEGWQVPDHVHRLGIEALTVDVRSVDGAFPTLTYPFHLPDVRVGTFDPVLGDHPEEPVVVARVDDQSRRGAGDRIALIDRSGYITFWGATQGLALWSRPGPEQDRLARRGWLLPPDYPTGLPDQARRAELELVGLPADRTLEVEPGGRVRVEVRGRHAGSGSPWPDAASDASRARVRVVARVVALDGGPDGARSGGELPRWLLPGDTFTSTAEVVAADEGLAPLPDGRYRVTIGVGQDDPPWFAPGGDTGFTLVVGG